MKSLDKEPLFGISVAAKLLGITPRILRSYEEAALIQPYRTDGQTRLYSQQDIRKLQLICYLHKEKEVNIAGIKIILEMITFRRTVQQVNQNSLLRQEEEEIIVKIREIAPELLGE